jgi:hypothetical protein
MVNRVNGADMQRGTSQCHAGTFKELLHRDSNFLVFLGGLGHLSTP